MQDNYLIIGTAGHVDHGKSQLIKVLTGISTDRLKEEKERGMSIELGFAYLTLPDGRKAGIIDVPGHEKFVRQMLAGASGMDVVLLVIAADEGIMPQTEEHLSILSLLGISNAIVVVTKIDLVDEDWLSMVEEDIREKLSATPFSLAPICRVSSVSGIGLADLIKTITGTVNHVESRNSNLSLRMPIDRVFSVQGFGTVVTGTLKSGVIRKGQEVHIEPGALQTKIRNIQVHNEHVDIAFAGQRAAINISGLSVEDVQRGSNIVQKNMISVGQILDVSLYNLSSNLKPLVQRQRIHFYIGTAEVLGRIHLLDQDQLNPGEECLAQIILEQPVVAVKGDRFVLRFFSPVITIGGGKVISIAPYKKKRFKESIINRLNLTMEGTTEELIAAELFQPMSTAETIKKLGLEENVVLETLDQMVTDEQIITFSDDEQKLFWSKEKADEYTKKITQIINEYNKRHPLRNGMSREELKNKVSMNFSPRRWQALLEWLDNNHEVTLVDGQVQTTDAQELSPAINKRLVCLKELWLSAGLNPPVLDEGRRQCQIGEKDILEYASYLCSTGQWRKIGDLYFDHKVVEDAKEKLIQYLKQNHQITAAEARDLWQTSRKYALPLLEYFDAARVTKRDENVRYLF